MENTAVQWKKLNVLIINGANPVDTSQGEFSETLVSTAYEVFSARGCTVKITRLMDTYNIEEEVCKYLWADLIVYQMPIWFMGPPWSMKKYMDEVFNAGQLAFYNEACPSYGTGGRLKKKFYMLSMTWGAPAQAFTINPTFFQGATPDSIVFGFHKANEYLGMQTLPSFIAFNVDTKPRVAREVERFSKHLEVLLEMSPLPDPGGKRPSDGGLTGLAGKQLV